MTAGAAAGFLALAAVSVITQLRRTLKLRGEGVALLAVYGRAGCWVHVTRCTSAIVATVAGT